MNLAEGSLRAGSNYGSDSMLNYDVGLNQGLANSISYGMGYFTGTVSNQNPISATLLNINGAFSSSNSQRMGISSSGEFTYNGTKPIYVTISVGVAIKSNDNAAEFTYSLFKSGSGGNNELAGSAQKILFKSTGDAEVAPIIYSTTLNSGDKVGVYGLTSETSKYWDLSNLQNSIKE